MKAEEHPLSQKPLIERITPGPWAWQKFGNAYNLTAQHGMREIILSANPQRGSMQPVVVMNQDGILQPIDPTHPNAEAISRVPELLKAEQELASYKADAERYRELVNTLGTGLQLYEELKSKNRELEETIAEQKAKIKILEAEDLQLTILNQKETISRLHKANFGLEKSRVELSAKAEDQKNQLEARLREALPYCETDGILTSQINILLNTANKP